MRNYIYLLIVVLFVNSCVDSEIKDKRLFKIAINTEYTKGDYDLSCVTDYDLISLDTNDSCQIGNISKIIFQGEKYYILDKLSNCIFIFSDSGRYISTLNRKGLGPGEYVSIDNFTVFDGNLWICDNASSRIICYDNRLNVVDIVKYNGFYVSDITISNKDVFLLNSWGLNGEANSRLCIYNMKDRKKTFKGFVSLPKSDIMRWGMWHQMAAMNNSLLFIPNYYTDTIYSYKNGGFTPEYKLDFTGHMQSIAQKGRPNPEMIILNNFYVIKNSIVVEYINKKKLGYAIYNKSLRKCITYTGFIDKYLGGLKLYNVTFTVDGGILATYNAYDFIPYYRDILSKNKFRNIGDKLKIEEFVSRLKNDDNPVIVKFKLKDSVIL